MPTLPNALWSAWLHWRHFTPYILDTYCLRGGGCFVTTSVMFFKDLRSKRYRICYELPYGHATESYRYTYDTTSWFASTECLCRAMTCLCWSKTHLLGLRANVGNVMKISLAKPVDNHLPANIHPYPDFNGGKVKPPLMLEHGWVIAINIRDILILSNFFLLPVRVLWNATKHMERISYRTKPVPEWSCWWSIYAIFHVVFTVSLFQMYLPVRK